VTSFLDLVVRDTDDHLQGLRYCSTHGYSNTFTSVFWVLQYRCSMCSNTPKIYQAYKPEGARELVTT
jgi:hypothetical protein